MKTKSGSETPPIARHETRPEDARPNGVANRKTENASAMEDEEPDIRKAKLSGGSQTVDRALAILKMIAVTPGEGWRLLDVARESDLDRATTYRLLTSLVNFNLIDQDSQTKRYSLGLEFFALAAAASNRYDLTGVARLALDRLSSLTGDTAIFCLRSNANLVCVDVRTGNFPIKTLPMDIGSHRPLGAGATGIAFLSALPDFELDKTLEQSADRLMRSPGQSVQDIRMAIMEARRLGYALGPEEPQGRIIGLSIPLLTRHGRPLGTLSITGIAERFDPARLEELIGLLRQEGSVMDEEVRKMPEDQRHRNQWA